MNFPHGTNQSLLVNYNPTQSEICEIFKQIRTAEKSGKYIHVEQLILSNGLSVGEFCMWYIVSNRTLCFNGNNTRDVTIPKRKDQIILKRGGGFVKNKNCFSF